MNFETGILGVINLLLLAVLLSHLRTFKDQLYEAKEARLADHSRRRMQATLDFYTSTRDSREILRKRLDIALGTDSLTESQVRELIRRHESGNPEASEAIYALRHLLGLLETLALGVNAGVYDEAIVRRIGASFMRQTFYRFRPYIEWRRHQGTPKYYVEYEALLGRL